MKGLPANSTCMLLSPTQLWDNKKVDFLSDPDIAETVLGDRSNPTLRGDIFLLQLRRIFSFFLWFVKCVANGDRHVNSDLPVEAIVKIFSRAGNSK